MAVLWNVGSAQLSRLERVPRAAATPHASNDRIGPIRPRNFDAIFGRPASRATPGALRTSFNNKFGVPGRQGRGETPSASFDYIYQRPASGATCSTPRPSFSNIFGVPPSRVTSRSTIASRTRPGRRPSLRTCPVSGGGVQRRPRTSTIYFGTPASGAWGLINHRVVNTAHAHRRRSAAPALQPYFSAPRERGYTSSAAHKFR
ncbi:hypothetical protein FB451DRAFT_1413672 [Mycena latifolia]|nr:hypothetical protein FB451DRAFT_1413672 [Mycena latifolia]